MTKTGFESLMLIKGTKGMGWRFSCVPAGMERHSLDLLRAVKNIVGCENVEFVIESWCGVKIVWLYNIKLEQEMRNLACGDHLGKWNVSRISLQGLDIRYKLF